MSGVLTFMEPTRCEFIQELTGSSLLGLRSLVVGLHGQEGCELEDGPDPGVLLWGLVIIEGFPKGPRTQDLRFQSPNTINSMVLGTKSL